MAQLSKMREKGDFKLMTEQGVPVPDLLQLAETSARGRWAYTSGRYDEAARIYREAAAIEGRITYMEPPWWYYPVDQSLGRRTVPRRQI